VGQQAFLDDVDRRSEAAASIPHIDYVREAGSEGIEMVMWLIARGAMADVAGGPKPKVKRTASTMCPPRTRPWAT
jgi:protocatechuate 4,5-dioxygenase beta chain